MFYHAILTLALFGPLRCARLAKTQSTLRCCRRSQQTSAHSTPSSPQVATAGCDRCARRSDHCACRLASLTSFAPLPHTRAKASCHTRAAVALLRPRHPHQLTTSAHTTSTARLNITQQSPENYIGCATRDLVGDRSGQARRQAWRMAVRRLRRRLEVDRRRCRRRRRASRCRESQILPAGGGTSSAAIGRRRSNSQVCPTAPRVARPSMHIHGFGRDLQRAL